MKAFNNYSDYMNHLIEDKVTDMKNLNCEKCNECCSIFTQLTDEEYEFFTDYFRNNPDGKKAFNRAKNKISRSLRQRNMYLLCPFTDDNTKMCSIYDVRPNICKAFHCDRKLYKDFKKMKDSTYVDGIGANTFYKFFSELYSNKDWR